MKSIERVIPPNIGWLEVVLEKEEIDFLWSRVNEAKDNNNRITNSNLAGNVSLSRELTDKDDMWYTRVIEPLIFKYEEEFGPKNRHPYYLQNFWVNYQYQTEYNPIHDHTGKYSFVIWLKIPTRYEDQRKLPIALNSNSNSISNFSFRYSNLIGKQASYYYWMDPILEGKMLFFDAALCHQVYPFYQNDGERISISGNVESYYRTKF